jgi:hypothetical protein
MEGTVLRLLACGHGWVSELDGTAVGDGDGGGDGGGLTLVMWGKTSMSLMMHTVPLTSTVISFASFSAACVHRFTHQVIPACSHSVVPQPAVRERRYVVPGVGSIPPLQSSGVPVFCPRFLGM